jgi:hypothetical protein
MWRKSEKLGADSAFVEMISQDESRDSSINHMNYNDFKIIFCLALAGSLLNSHPISALA